MNDMLAALSKAGFDTHKAEICKHKQQYVSKEAACAVAGNGYDRKGWKLHTYQCPECGHWHLTKRPQKPANRRKD